MPTDSYYDPPDTHEYEECPHCSEKYPSGDSHMCDNTQDRLKLAEAKLLEFGIEWEDGKGYVFNGRDTLSASQHELSKCYCRTALECATQLVEVKETRWLCTTCGTAYAEYVNGCPHCWSAGIRAGVVEVEDTPNDKF